MSNPALTQLSLFCPINNDSDSKLAPNIIDGESQDYPIISVVSTCEYCKSTYQIAPHTAIHTVAWMRKHWKETSDNVFEKNTGYCSRQCEIKAK